MKLTVLALAALSVPAIAQVSYPPPDLTPYATNDSVTAAANAASAAQATATAAQNAIPPACAVAPANNTLTGAVGTASVCTPHPDGNSQTPVQTVNSTLDANCNWAVTFSRAFTNSSPIIKATVFMPGATQPMPCIVMMRSTTAANGKCYPAQTTLLNLSIITAGLTLAPFGQTCTAGTVVMIVGREPTQ